jgi:hypothetical protein
MALFTHWLTFRDVAFQLDLLETAQFFDPQAYNPVFYSELEKLIRRLPDGAARQEAMAMRTFDLAGYLERSLKTTFRDDDLQEHFHAIAIRLLVSPGKLFRGWEPERHGPLERRFKKSVWNAIRNIAEKTRNRRRWMTAVDPATMAGQYPGRAPYSDLIDQFRQLVAQKLGRLAVTIFDARLEGRDMKDLIGLPSIGTPSAFLLKRETRAIKVLARQFAAQSGDPSFSGMVAKAFDAEAATIAKRQAARQAQ